FLLYSFSFIIFFFTLISTLFPYTTLFRSKFLNTSKPILQIFPIPISNISIISSCSWFIILFFLLPFRIIPVYPTNNKVYWLIVQFTHPYILNNYIFIDYY